MFTKLHHKATDLLSYAAIHDKVWGLLTIFSHLHLRKKVILHYKTVLKKRYKPSFKNNLKGIIKIGWLKKKIFWAPLMISCHTSYDYIWRKSIQFRSGFVLLCYMVRIWECTCNRFCLREVITIIANDCEWLGICFTKLECGYQYFELYCWSRLSEMNTANCFMLKWQ